MKMKSFSKPEKWILIGIPSLFFIGSILHFAYNIFWESLVVGLFAPVNESIWEHTKMVLWPVILWWLLYYCFRSKQYSLNKNKWFGGALTALLTSLFTMPLLYYFYTQAFGVELLWVDILILLLSIILGQFLGLHIYRSSKGMDAKLVLVLFIVLVLLFMLFTFFPPHIPLFQDGLTGNYGIQF